MNESLGIKSMSMNPRRSFVAALRQRSTLAYDWLRDSNRADVQLSVAGWDGSSAGRFSHQGFVRPNDASGADGQVSWFGKRFVDLVISVAALPFAVILVALVAPMIALTSEGPVIFRQRRVGLLGREFVMFKLRTMRKGSADGTATGTSDVRVTPIGAVLRKFRIDELPQLINVIRGEMSLIGPRPEQPQLAKVYRAAIPNFDDRLLCRPGITGLAQVRCGYASTVKETRNKVRFDQIYVKNCSIGLDMYILIATLRTVLFGEGAR